MMQSSATMEILKDSSVPRPGLKLIELQRAEWDALGVDRDTGCSCLDQLHSFYPGDAELLQARDTFVLTAQRTYVAALEARRPKKLEHKKAMKREAIIEFFDACNTKMDLPETQERLYRHLADTKQMPNQLIITIQRDMLEVLGVEKEHGCNCLSRIAQDFPQDHELHQRFEGWRHKAQQACMTVVKKHQVSGGDMPSTPFGDNPELCKLQEKAKKEIDEMTPADRGQLITKMQKKMEVFVNLPAEGRQSYMKRLSEADRLEFVKTQILMVSLMKQQWQQQQQMVQQQDGQCPKGTESSHGSQVSEPGRNSAQLIGEVAPPQQQQMM